MYICVKNAENTDITVCRICINDFHAADGK